MANVGRISGPLLKANLVRNGINLAVEGTLLYIDVNNSRIGINNDTPAYDLDVTGTSQTTSLLTGEATIDDVYINDRNITVLSGDLILTGATVADYVIINDIAINQNEISSNVSSDILINTDPGSSVIINGKLTITDASNAEQILEYGSITILGEQSRALIDTNVDDLDLELASNGVGRVITRSDTFVNSNLEVSGNVFVDGNITVGGNITIGDADTDSITIGADFTSNLTPNASDLYDIGTESKAWRDLYTGVLKLTADTITTTATNGRIAIKPAGEGTIIMDSTKSMRVPLGTTGQRPTLTEPGHIRWNTTVDRHEGWDGFEWRPIPFGQAVTRHYFTASAAQTVFTGFDDTATEYRIVAGTEVVTKNGLVLEKNSEYTTTNTTLTLLSPANFNDEINVLSFSTFSIVDVVPQSTGGTFNGGVTVAGNINGTNNITAAANLFVNGVTTRINSTNVSISDRIVSIGTGVNGANQSGNDGQDRGVNFKWHNGVSAKDGFFGFDDSTGYFTFIPDATISGEVVTGTPGDIQATNFRGNVVSPDVSTETVNTTGDVVIGGDLDVEGYASFNTTSALKLPVGTTAQRPVPVEQGQIRYNPDLVTFEGYNGTAWGSLGGVIDTDRNTYIIAETSPGANNNELEFFVDSTRELLIDSTGLTLTTQLPVAQGGTGVRTFTTNGVLFGNNTGTIQVTAASNPGSNATTSFGILTTNASNVPQWTDTIDGGTY